MRKPLFSIYSWRLAMRWLNAYVFALFDLFRLPLSRWSCKLRWKERAFLRFFRNPQILAKIFRCTLRVCITYRCNSSCRYCYARGLEKDMPNDMTPDDFMRLVVWARKRGWKIIRFLGGEPTIHPAFGDFLNICRDNNMGIGISTNNLYSEPVATVLIRHKNLIPHISINYDEQLSPAEKTLFWKNIETLNRENIKFELSCVIGPGQTGEPGIVAQASRYKPIAIRASVAVPGLARETSFRQVVGIFQNISASIFEFQNRCLKARIPFYVYRPQMPCLFRKEDWRRLRGELPFVCYTRCPLGLTGDYTTTIVVNPDLSMFPCIAVFVKGPKITDFESRAQISEFYRKLIKPILSAPLRESCRGCTRHEHFVAEVEKDEQSKVTAAFSEKLCQGGCLSFREHSRVPCDME